MNKKIIFMLGILTGIALIIMTPVVLAHNEDIIMVILRTLIGAQNDGIQQANGLLKQHVDIMQKYQTQLTRLQEEQQKQINTLNGQVKDLTTQLQQVQKENESFKTVLGNFLTSGKPFRICFGKTEPGNTNWVQHTPTGVFLDVDTSAAGFQSTPLYFINMPGNGMNCLAVGNSSPYSITAKGFRIFSHLPNGSVTPAQANEWKWHIQWIAIGN